MKKQPFYLWQLKNNQATLYLFGTPYKASKTFFPLSRAILNRFHEADYFVCDCQTSLDTTSFECLESHFDHPHAVYPPGESLYHFFDRKTLTTLCRYLVKKNIYPSQFVHRFHKLRPHIINTMIYQARPHNLVLEPLLSNLAQKLNKPILSTTQDPLLSQLETYLQTDLTYFVAVGPLYLLGRHNLINHLQQKGYHPIPLAIH